MARIHLETPLSEQAVAQVRAGDEVLISGVIYTARDAAHKRIVEDLEAGRPLPFDPNGAIIYYVGPTPPKPGQVIGSAGPTTAYRMDRYTPTMLQHGVRALIGKGYRGDEVKQALVRYRGLYLVSTGGTGALLARRIEVADLIAYEELGTEAVRRLVVREFPTVCIHDVHGGDQYSIGQAQWRRPDALVQPAAPKAGE
jgi:fumarate hydratase subunit beta